MWRFSVWLLMAWGEFITFTGHIEAFTQKSILFCADNWTNHHWVTLQSKKGNVMSEVVEYDSDTKEATVKISAWLVDQNPEWQ